jgi:hypothetical protein
MNELFWYDSAATGAAQFYTNATTQTTTSVQISQDTSINLQAGIALGQIVYIDPSEPVNWRGGQFKLHLADQVSNDGGITWVYNADTLAAQATEVLKSQAQALLSASDYRVLPDKFSQYDSGNQTLITAYRESLRDVIRGTSAVIPTLTLGA